MYGNIHHRSVFFLACIFCCSVWRVWTLVEDWFLFFLIIHTDSPTGDLQTKLPCFFPFVFFFTSPFLCLFPQSFFFSLRNHIVHLIVVWLAQPPQSSHMSQCVYVGSLEMPVTWLQTPMRRLMWRMEATVLNWRLCKSLFPPRSLSFTLRHSLSHTRGISGAEEPH